VSQKENVVLTTPYFEEEVNKAVFQMEYNKTPDLDAFPPEFYQTF
jgi:hypothetical protein